MPYAESSTAAYLYILTLDGPGRAWEYLRRNPAYRRDAAARDASDEGSAALWGLRFPRES